MLAYPDWKNSGFGIYLHWPYCESKCPYCDFNSYVEKNVNWYEWELSFLSQLGFYYQETGDRRVNSIFFGGGGREQHTQRTPSTGAGTGAGAG